MSLRMERSGMKQSLDFRLLPYWGRVYLTLGESSNLTRKPAPTIAQSVTLVHPLTKD